MPPADIFQGLDEYRWHEWATERYTYDTPDRTHHDHNFAIQRNEDHWLRLGMLNLLYGPTSLNAQEN